MKRSGSNSRQQKSGERGFALLLVFLMAAAIALMLYQQMPRVAFESERDKEQILIDRGEQYERAIQLFVAVNKNYPARIEDLENTNDKRFLRKRYIDPFTGKTEWRLIHTNGMFLTDSLVQKPPSANPDGSTGDKSKDSPASGTASTGNSGTGVSSASTPGSGTPGTGTGTDAPPEVNATVLQRPSDRTLPTGIPGQFNPQQPADPNNPNQPSQGFPGQGAGGSFGAGSAAFPPITLAQIQATTGQPGANGQGSPQPGSGQTGVVPSPFPAQNGVGPFPGQGGMNPSQFQPGQFQPGQVQAGQFQPGQVQPGQVPFGQGPGANGAQGIPGLPGGAAGGPNNAINMINQLLTSPRTPPAGVGGPAANTAMGGGIAGVASTFSGPSIKSYNTRTRYNEWEFVFQNQQQGMPGQNNTQPNGQPAQGQPGMTGTPAPTSPTAPTQ